MALQVSNTGQAMFLGDIEAAAPDDGLEQDFAPKRSPSYLLVQFTLQFTPAAAWLAVATSRYVIGLDQQSYLGLGLVTAYTSSELVLLGTSRYVRVDDGSPMEAFVRAVLVHGLAAWYLVLHHVQAAAADPIANSALMYASLVLVGTFGWLAHWRLRADKLAALAASAQAKELRVQYDALRKLVKGGLGYFSDSEEEDGGDQREHLIKPPASIMLSAGAFGKPELAFTEALHGLSFDRELALRIAAQIRRKHYTLDRFYSDVQAAFPELQLYLVELPSSDPDDVAAEVTAHRPSITSGLHPDAEYRRTIGALFAVYWLMRIGIDGERGFSFGVDDSWKPHMPPTPEGGDGASASGSNKSVKAGWDKRLAFYESQDWGRLQALLVDAQLLESRGSVSEQLEELLRKDHRKGRRTSAASRMPKSKSAPDLHSEDLEGVHDGVRTDLTVNVERTMAMLALTAFHDVMKIEALLPVVKEEHAPFLGFKAGDTINDHDCALAYVLDYYSDQLPSFKELSVADQRTVRFTQSKMQFNHGWLVQGEAPPSALFAKFKQVMLSDSVTPSDVAFYFVHWLTDLAGAEPSPLGGGEKLVLKFPHAVLDSFIRSFSVLNDLALRTETQVMEEYLVRTWGELGNAALGAAPTSEDGVALMRLVLQAQTPDKQNAVMGAFEQLPADDRDVLRNEMARTGIHGQSFHRAPAFGSSLGPSFLVYYSPAFLRTLAPANANEALVLLAEVYRRARKLWPLRPTNSNDHAVTIRIDQIKELKLDDIRGAIAEGHTWLLCRKNDLEGVVEKHDVESVAELMGHKAKQHHERTCSRWPEPRTTH